jgi:hypothetical protein
MAGRRIWSAVSTTAVESLRAYHAPEVGRWSEGEICESNLEVPFYMTNFVGGRPGRFRVKARNRLGESDCRSIATSSSRGDFLGRVVGLVEFIRRFNRS